MREEDEGDYVGAIVSTYGKGKESKAKQHSCITDKRENPHVVIGDVSMNAKVEAWKCGAGGATTDSSLRSFDACMLVCLAEKSLSNGSLSSSSSPLQTTCTNVNFDRLIYCDNSALLLCSRTSTCLT